MSKNIKNNRKKPILLCILDGWGIGDKDSPDNAIAVAKTPNYDQILANYPSSKLVTSGLDVGLPEGQMGNSEVGHVAIGAGRVVFKDLPRIHVAIKNGDLHRNLFLQNLIANCQKSGGDCHLLGLLSDGGVHSHQDHIITLAKIVAANNIKVKIHAFLDGRDVAQKSAIEYIQNFSDQTSDFKNIEIVTISGRYYAMDRDRNWDRVILTYNALVNGIGTRIENIIEFLNESYEEMITDEFILPTIVGNYSGMKDGDALLVANFRADRIRQICSAIVDSLFCRFNTRKIDFVSKVAMAEYSYDLNKYFQILFPSIEITNSLGEVLQNNNLKQLRIAESEKYAHVTFFFGGGKEIKFKGEERILVKSKNVPTYDLMPQMSAAEISDELIKAINSNQHDFIIVNYANPDMVGHSGKFRPAIRACEAIDAQLGNLRDAILAADGIMLITADHGNIEDMVDNNNCPHTSHTTNPVPLILIGNEVKNYQLKDGRLCDIAPTILSLMNIDKPVEMTGENLLLNSSKNT